MSYTRPVDPFTDGPSDYFVEYVKRPLCGLLPTEVRRALDPETLHARPQLGIEEHVCNRAHDFVHGVRVEDDRGAVHHFRQRRSVGADYRAAASHRFQRGKAETLVKRRE